MNNEINYNDKKWVEISHLRKNNRKWKRKRNSKKMWFMNKYLCFINDYEIQFKYKHWQDFTFLFAIDQKYFFHLVVLNDVKIGLGKLLCAWMKVNGVPCWNPYVAVLAQFDVRQMKRWTQGVCKSGDVIRSRPKESRCIQMHLTAYCKFKIAI